jgi:predicted secreted protein
MAGLPVNDKTTIYGDKLMLYYDGKPIALGQTCSLEISADTIDTTTKMSGNYKEFLTGQLSFTISSESLLTYSSTASGVADLTKYSTFKDLVKLMTDRDPVEFKIATAKGADQDYAADVDFISGMAIITQCSASAQTGQLTTCSIQMQGTGELTVSESFAAPTE